MKKTSVYIIPFIAVASVSIQAMDMLLLTPLTKIEKQLVLREIQTRGFKVFSDKIRNISSPTLELVDLESGRHILTYPKVGIEAILHKNEIQTNELAKNVFNAITEFEKTYLPLVPWSTNHLNDHTSYTWLEENGKPIDAVKITVHLGNIGALLSYVADVAEYNAVAQALGEAELVLQGKWDSLDEEKATITK